MQKYISDFEDKTMDRNQDLDHSVAPLDLDCYLCIYGPADMMADFIQ